MNDIEFDLENDEHRCLYGVDSPSVKYIPSDTQRVTQIFEKPQFFKDGAQSKNVVQGKLGDCWFLSALATVSTAQGLVEKFCVARDEEVGVYGFMFFRDNAWVSVVIDDMLFTSVPKYEELTAVEKELYHEDKAQFNHSARKGGKTLYFARSGATGETWVPLIEKAYAKLHGDYASLSGGKHLEAVEDLTGGVSTAIINKDILDVDRFWNEELLKANQDRLFGCSFDRLTSRSGIPDVKIDGLIGNHAYSVLRAVECKGKRFVVLRNPWGTSEWTGRWSDGSREWTAAWLEILPLLQHEFGDDGQFVMEYCDFLDVWDQIHRTILFDSTWIMSSQWLQVPVRPLPSAWSYGDVVFTFSLPKRALTIVVLSQLDQRYFRDIAGNSTWTLDFVLVKRGDSLPMAETSSALGYSRSVNVELELDEGEYNVYTLWQFAGSFGSHDNQGPCEHLFWTVLFSLTEVNQEYFKKGVESGWDHRKLSRTLTERTKSRSVASKLTGLLDQDRAQYEKKKAAECKKKQREEAEEGEVRTVTVTVTTTTTTTTVRKKSEPTDSSATPAVPSRTVEPTDGTCGTPPQTIHIPPPSPTVPQLPPLDTCINDQIGNNGCFQLASPRFHSFSPLPRVPFVNLPTEPPPIMEIEEDENSVFLGLRVYTKNTIAVVGGLLYGDLPGLDSSPPGTRPPSPHGPSRQKKIGTHLAFCFASWLAKRTLYGAQIEKLRLATE
ncbi:hypothetical protein DXG03_001550 [Asterophora parasitica]|uniref:Calpain catalytic domain-containing protein n=1 Tax=Asterophora parasitica TaxID=117018 RepID=A0A9P7KBI9_9AGAR|nr:hypothetical protein DXG03_001550 [Asterophora parasitica]